MEYSGSKCFGTKTCNVAIGPVQKSPPYPNDATKQNMPERISSHVNLDGNKECTRPTHHPQRSSCREESSESRSAIPGFLQSLRRVLWWFCSQYCKLTCNQVQQREKVFVALPVQKRPQPFILGCMALKKQVMGQCHILTRASKKIHAWEFVEALPIQSGSLFHVGVQNRQDSARYLYSLGAREHSRQGHGRELSPTLLSKRR